jgi:anti-sigma regulatory factor (Ser/Thr protein kinase)
VGRGIAALDEALRDGFSTYHGLGLGLPGAKRLMDRFHLSSVPGEGTTVTMQKWLT